MTDTLDEIIDEMVAKRHVKDREVDTTQTDTYEEGEALGAGLEAATEELRYGRDSSVGATA